MKQRTKWSLVAVVVLLVVVVVYGWSKYRSAFRANKGDVPKVLLVPPGAGFDQVVDSLVALDVLVDVDAFRWTAEKKKYIDRVKPGRYVIPPRISNNDLVNKLRSGDQDPVRVTFSTARTLPELAGRIASYLVFDSLDMLAAMRAPAMYERYGFNEATFVCLFVPNTYELWWTETPEGFIERMGREFKRFWTPERRKAAAALGLTTAEVGTLATIVEGETSRLDEAPRVAGLYLNRLRIGMPLQADPTLVFAGNLRGVNRVINADKSIDSPYNTYLHKGLPPGPIKLPDPRYIDAVLGHERHDYLYMCARADGSGYHDMAKTYEQHLVNARRYQRSLDQRGTYR